MNNKVLIEELKRVTEIMGISSPHLIVEDPGKILARIILKLAGTLPRIVDNQAFIKLFDNQNLYKAFKKEFADITSNKELLEQIEKNFDTIAGQNAIKRFRCK